MAKRGRPKKGTKSVAAFPDTMGNFPLALRGGNVASTDKAKETGGGVTLVTWQWVIDFLSPLLGALIPALSVAFRSEIETALKKWKVAADKTPNPWDNFLIDFLARILGVTLT